jgi:hypothetical protein
MELVLQILIDVQVVDELGHVAQRRYFVVLPEEPECQQECFDRFPLRTGALRYDNPLSGEQPDADSFFDLLGKLGQLQFVHRFDEYFQHVAIAVFC